LTSTLAAHRGPVQKTYCPDVLTPASVLEA